MKKTVGIFLVTENEKMLIGHPTYHSPKSWSIPKGLIDEGEEEIHTGFRELKEETGIDLNIKVKDILFIKKLFNQTYKHKGKQLVPFVIQMKSDDIMEEELVCDSMVEMEGREPFPEVDKYQWVDFETALTLIHDTQKEALKEYMKCDKEWLEL